MKLASALAVLLSSSLLVGCQNMWKTMLPHVRMDDRGAELFAQANATVNFCVATNQLPRDIAFDFSVTAADYLDFVVFNNDYYRGAYRRHSEELQRRNETSSLAEECAEAQRRLPEITQMVRESHRASAQRIATMRIEESRRIAISLGNLGSSSVPLPNVQAAFPSFQYTDERPATQSYLLNTLSGLRQCRVTSSGYVFCI